jgi:hypothetical protein
MVPAYKKKERNPVGPDISQVAEDEGIHDGRHQGVDDEPKRPENRLLVLGNEVALDEEGDQIPIPNHLAKPQVKKLSPRFYH